MGRPKKVINKGGRPTVITPEVLAKLEQAFAIDASVEEALSYASIKPDAYYDYLKKNPAFSERIKELRQLPVLAARERAVKGVKENYSNAMDYLKRKKKAEFGDESKIGMDIGLEISFAPIFKKEDADTTLKTA